MRRLTESAGSQLDDIVAALPAAAEALFAVDAVVPLTYIGIAPACRLPWPIWRMLAAIVVALVGSAASISSVKSEEEGVSSASMPKPCGGRGRDWERSGERTGRTGIAPVSASASTTLISC